MPMEYFSLPEMAGASGDSMAHPKCGATWEGG
jgi:hypothetical protein